MLKTDQVGKDAQDSWSSYPSKSSYALKYQDMCLKLTLCSNDFQINTFVSRINYGLTSLLSNDGIQHEDISIFIKKIQGSCIMVNSNWKIQILEALELWKRGSVKACMIVSVWVTSVLKKHKVVSRNTMAKSHTIKILEKPLTS